MRYAIVFIACLLFTGGAYAQESSESTDEDLQKVLDAIEQSGQQEGEPVQVYTEENENSDKQDYNTDEEPASTHTQVDAREVAAKKGYDAENMTVRRFDRGEWKKIVAGKDYSGRSNRRKRDGADSAATGDHDSRRFRDSDDDDFDDSSDASFNLGPLNSPIVTYIVYGVAIALIAYVLFMVLRGVSLRSNPKVSKDADLDGHASVEDIRELEVDRLLREALAAGNYRLVIRMYFLGLLKKLDEEGFIAWKKDKTNREYLGELFTKAYHFEEIRMLTRAYEEVWYSDHTLSPQAYTQIIASFEAMQRKINVSNPGEK